MFWLILKQLALSDLLQLLVHLILLWLSRWWWKQSSFFSAEWKFRRLVFCVLLVFVVWYHGDTIWNAYQKASANVQEMCNVMSYAYNKAACENVRPSP